MVLEVALIDVVPGQEDEFAAAYGKAREILAGTEGCRSVRMTRGVESPSRFVPLLEWDGALALAITVGLALTATTASATTASASSTDLPEPTHTAPVTATGTGYGQLVNVRTGRHATYDRVVFDFTSGTPGYRVAYGTLVG